METDIIIGDFYNQNITYVNLKKYFKSRYNIDLTYPKQYTYVEYIVIKVDYYKNLIKAECILNNSVNYYVRSYDVKYYVNLSQLDDVDILKKCILKMKLNKLLN